MVLRSFYAAFISLTLAWHCGAFETENLAVVKTQITQYLAQHYDTNHQGSSNTVSDGSPKSEKQGRVKIALGSIDPRLKLHKCDESLTFSLKDSGVLGGNITVKTACKGRRPWTIFVSAHIETKSLVIVTKHSLSRGTIIQEDDIHLRHRITSNISSGFASDPARVIGKQLRRDHNRGDVIRLRNLVEPKVVKRGDVVTIEASTSTILVVTAGTALSDGYIGQQIRVKNAKSERIIRAEVIAPARVRVIL